MNVPITLNDVGGLADPTVIQELMLHCDKWFDRPLFAERKVDAEFSEEVRLQAAAFAAANVVARLVLIVSDTAHETEMTTAQIKKIARSEKMIVVVRTQNIAYANPRTIEIVKEGKIGNLRSNDIKTDLEAVNIRTNGVGFPLRMESPRRKIDVRPNAPVATTPPSSLAQVELHVLTEQGLIKGIAPFENAAFFIGGRKVPRTQLELIEEPLSSSCIAGFKGQKEYKQKKKTQNLHCFSRIWGR